MELQDDAGKGDAEGPGNLLDHGIERRGMAGRMLLDIGKAEDIDAGEEERAHEAGEKQHADHHQIRRLREEQRIGRRADGGEGGGEQQRAAEAEPREDLARGELGEQRPTRRHECDHAGMEGREPEAELQHQGQQERHRAHGDAEDRAGDDAGAEGIDLEEIEVEDRMRVPPRMAHEQQYRQRPDDHRDDADDRRQRRQTDHGEPEHEAGGANARKEEAGNIGGRRCRAVDSGQVDPRERNADETDGHIDEENPFPAEIGGDEAADRRTDQRADHARNGEHRHGRNQFALLGRAQQDRAANRSGHRTAHALQETRQHEGDQAVGQGAEDGAGHEHEDRGDEHAFRPELFCRPAGERNEHPERHEIRGHRQLERDRPDIQVARDGRQRGGDDGRVHLLHEESDGKDERGKAIQGKGPEICDSLDRRGGYAPHHRPANEF